MKVLQINTVYGISSTGRTTKELHEALQEKGIESIVAVTKTNTEGESLYFIGNKFDWKLHGLLSRIFGTQGYFSFFSTKKLLKYINKEKPDVIHLRNLHGNYINVPSLLKYISKEQIPTVITLHDCWFFTGKCCYFTDSNCDRWQRECGNCPALKKWNKSWFFDRSRKMLLDKKKYFSKIKNLAVIGVSNWVTDLAEQSILKDAKVVKRIYNWIDLAVCKPTESNIRTELNLDSDFVVLGVAQRWNQLKGLNIFIDAAKALPEYKFVMVGNMPKDIELPSNIISVGVVNKVEELVKYYSMADVFLNPSVQETFGKTTAEAICCGTPVIGYNLTATPELIGEKCGLIIDENIESVIRAINQIKEKGKQSFSTDCLDFALNNFSKEFLINEYINVYNDIVKQ